MAIAGIALAALTADAVGQRATLLGLAAATLPAPILVTAVLAIDRLEPEPPRLLALTFAWGATVAVLVSTIVNRASGRLLSGPLGDRSGDAVVAVVVAPLVEEAVKALALLAVLRWARHEVNGVVDGLVYAGVIGLGFAVGENVHYFGAALRSGDAVLVLLVRSVFSPFAHPLFSAPLGLGVAVALASGSGHAGGCHRGGLRCRRRGACSLERDLPAHRRRHRGDLPGRVRPGLRGPCRLGARAQRHEADRIRRCLAPDVAAGTLSGELVDEAASPQARRRALKRSMTEGGPAAKRRRRDVHPELAEEALARARRSAADDRIGGAQARLGRIGER